MTGNDAVVITRRAETADDAAFLFALFAASRPPQEELAGVEPALREMLLRHQFAGQTASYRAAYPDAAFEIVERAGRPIGRIVVHVGDDAVTLVDIALLADWRGHGIGTILIGDVVAHSDRPVRLSVRHGNTRARALYRRLGFATIAETETETRMERACP